MFSADTQKYSCPSGHPAAAVCVDPACQSLCFICADKCSICSAKHSGHIIPMPINSFLMSALQRPNIDPILLDTYDKLVELLENDPSLGEFCDELPEWFSDRLNSQF